MENDNMRLNIVGNGNWEYKDKFKYEVEFKIEVNLEIVRVYSCPILIKIPMDKYEIDYNNMPRISWELSGKDANGRSIKINQLNVNSCGYCGDYYSLGCDFSKIEISADINYNKLDFFIPNFSCGAMSEVILKYLDRDYKLLFSSLNLDPKNAFINDEEHARTSNYFNGLKILIETDEKVEVKKACNLMDILTDLLSIINGTKVKWRNVVGITDHSISHAIIKNITVDNIPTYRKLIDFNLYETYNLNNYIKSCFNTYANMSVEEKKSLISFVDNIQLSSKEKEYPAPFTILGNAIEKYAKDTLNDKSNHYVNRATRKILLPLFKEFINKGIWPYLDKSDKCDFDEDNIKNKLSALVQRNLRTRITNLLENFKIPFDPIYVQDFVKKRNSSAHGEYIFKDNDFFIYSRIASLLEQSVLKRIGYNGEFIDWAEGTKNSRKLL